MKQDKNQIEEKLLKEKQMLRESLNTESLEVNKRVDKVNLDRMNDVADIQSKVTKNIFLYIVKKTKIFENYLMEKTKQL